MYSRSYIGQPASARIPDGYDGVAIREPETGEKLDTGEAIAENSAKQDSPALNPWEEKSPEKAEGKEESVGAFSFLGGSLGNLFNGVKLPFLGSLKMPKIGTEEILILVAAAYLLFSKDGDKECAVILILLLFVT